MDQEQQKMRTNEWSPRARPKLFRALGWNITELFLLLYLSQIVTLSAMRWASLLCGSFPSAPFRRLFLLFLGPFSSWPWLVTRDLRLSSYVKRQVRENGRQDSFEQILTIAFSNRRTTRCIPLGPNAAATTFPICWLGRRWCPMPSSIYQMILKLRFEHFESILSRLTFGLGKLQSHPISFIRFQY